MVTKRVTLIFLTILSLLALYLCFIIFQPFITPLLTALVIGIVFYPVHSRIQLLVRRPGLAAFSSTVLVTLILIIPALMIIAALTKEVSGLVELVSEKSDEAGGLLPYVNHLIERPLGWLGQYVDTSQVNIRQWVQSRLTAISGFLINYSTAFINSIVSSIVDAVITIFTLFFFFREGKSLRRRLAALMPLSNEQTERLFSGIENTIVGTVYGGLVVAAVQGAMIGLSFWVLGLPSPVLWGVMAAFFALLPVVGTAAVWVPGSIYLLAGGGYVKAIVLAVWGAGVVGTIDNILRPYLIGGRVEMHTLLIFFAVFGGVNIFGFLGLFIGPVIVAVTATLLKMFRDESRTWIALWREPAAEAAESPPT